MLADLRHGDARVSRLPGPSRTTGWETAGPVGGVPVAVPVLVTLPRSTSAWVVV